MERPLRTIQASAMCLHFSMQEDDILEHTNVKCYLCKLQSTCRPLCKMIGGRGVHLITIFNILMPRQQQVHLNTKCHEVTLQVKLLNISVTQDTPLNRVSDIITHVTLNTINFVVVGFQHVKCHSFVLCSSYISSSNNDSTNTYWLHDTSSFATCSHSLMLLKQMWTISVRIGRRTCSCKVDGL